MRVDAAGSSPFAMVATADLAGPVTALRDHPRPERGFELRKRAGQPQPDSGLPAGNAVGHGGVAVGCDECPHAASPACTSVKPFRERLRSHGRSHEGWLSAISRRFTESSRTLRTGDGATPAYEPCS